MGGEEEEEGNPLCELCGCLFENRRNFTPSLEKEEGGADRGAFLDPLKRPPESTWEPDATEEEN